MNGFVRAVALDLDRTLTEGAVLSTDAMEAVREGRASGLLMVLVTGRIQEECEAEFGRLSAQFDAVVTENGAVLSIDGAVRRTPYRRCAGMPTWCWTSRKAAQSPRCSAVH